VPRESEALDLALTDRMPADPPADVLPHDATPEQIDAALRAVAAGLIVRALGPEPLNFAMAPNVSPCRRERLKS
jgi:hypothetical protein